jgi:hypothetical protein
LVLAGPGSDLSEESVWGCEPAAATGGWSGGPGLLFERLAERVGVDPGLDQERATEAFGAQDAKQEMSGVDVLVLESNRLA